jgi:hypothetical protein
MVFSFLSYPEAELEAQVNAQQIRNGNLVKSAVARVQETT